MVAPEQSASHVEVCRKDAVSSGQDGSVLELIIVIEEDAEEGRLPVVFIEAAEESMVGN